MRQRNTYRFCVIREVIGTYVTAGARIHLYRYLYLLQEKAIYCDTDSVIHIQPRDEPELIETKDKLGDMTSELRPPIKNPNL